MSLRDRVPVLDVRNLSPTVDGGRVLRWAVDNPGGFLCIADAPAGGDPARHSWFQCAALSRAWAFRAFMRQRGVDARFAIGWRFDVLAPSRTAFTAPDPALVEVGFERVVARSPGHPFGDALAAFGSAGWSVRWPDGIATDFMAALPRDAAVYYHSPTLDVVARELELSGVLSNPWAAGFIAWAASHAARCLEAYGAELLIVGAKPWLRAASGFASPSSIGAAGGLIQPTPYGRPGEWEAATSLVLSALGERGLPFVTLTRPPVPPLVELIGDATASSYALGEADLTVFA